MMRIPGWIRTIMVVWIALAVLPVAAQDTAEVWLTSDARQLSMGQEAVITINVSRVAQAYGASLRLRYDPQALEPVAATDQPVTPGAFFEGRPGFALRNAFDQSAGVVEYALTLMQPAEPVSGEGVLGVITVRALKDGPLSLALDQLTFVSAQFETVNGQQVARSVAQVRARIQPSVFAGTQIAVVPQIAPEVASELSGETVLAPTTVPAQDQQQIVSMFSNPALDQTDQGVPVQNVSTAASAAETGTSPAVIALLLLGLGFLLLVASLFLYARTRLRFVEADFSQERA